MPCFPGRRLHQNVRDFPCPLFSWIPAVIQEARHNALIYTRAETARLSLRSAFATFLAGSVRLSALQIQRGFSSATKLIPARDRQDTLTYMGAEGVC